MNSIQLKKIQKARECFLESGPYLDQGFSKYCDLFEANPKAWWFAMEAIRCKRASMPYTERENLLVYHPEYANNSYQRNLYLESRRFKYHVLPLGHLVIDERLVMATFARNFVFHQHWLKDVYWDAKSAEAGLILIERHIGILKALKSYGATILWTLHNLIDHDATPLQEKLNSIVLKQMINVSDRILIHSPGAGEQLSSYCGRNLSEKLHLLNHPLYDDLLYSARPYLPQEIKREKLAGRRVLLSVGMIRPYKGVPGLLLAFQKVVQGDKDQGLHLIIAGRLHDPEVLEVLQGLDEQTQGCISLVARRLEDEELAGLMRLAHVSVTSYRRILTSGSYYLATTFAKPTVAPEKGMFAEVVRDNETGFLYDGSVESLATVLRRVASLPEADLVRVGNNALQACRDSTVAAVSRRFFSFLGTGE